MHHFFSNKNLRHTICFVLCFNFQYSFKIKGETDLKVIIIKLLKLNSVTKDTKTILSY